MLTLFFWGGGGEFGDSFSISLLHLLEVFLGLKFLYGVTVISYLLESFLFPSSLLFLFL